MSSCRNLLARELELLPLSRDRRAHIDVTRTMPVSGRFDAGELSDIAAFYQETPNRMTVRVFERADAQGHLVSRVTWDGEGWELPRVQPVSGDFDGDDRSEVAVFYDYGRGQSSIWLWENLFVEQVNGIRSMSEEGAWERVAAKLWAADLDGDGADEVGALYDEGEGRRTLRVFDDLSLPRFSYRITGGPVNVFTGLPGRMRGRRDDPPWRFHSRDGRRAVIVTAQACPSTPLAAPTSGVLP